jgi:hypothetical protein
MRKLCRNRTLDHTRISSVTVIRTILGLLYLDHTRISYGTVSNMYMISNVKWLTSVTVIWTEVLSRVSMVYIYVYKTKPRHKIMREREEEREMKGWRTNKECGTATVRSLSWCDLNTPPHRGRAPPRMESH